MKKCTKCGVEKPLEYFYRHKDAAAGHRPDCKECCASYYKIWKIANKASVVAKQREWARKNKVRINEARRKIVNANRDEYNRSKRDWNYQNLFKRRASSKKWNRANKDRLKTIVAQWKQENKAILAEQAMARYALKVQAIPKWANKYAIQNVYKMARQKTLETGQQWHVDHVVPLKSKFVCGLHVEHNLRVVPALQNLEKNNRYWPDMPEPIHA